MADGIEIEVSDRIASTIASKLRSIKNEATAADTAIDRLKASLNLGNSAGLLKAARDAETFNRSLRTASQIIPSVVGRTSSLTAQAERLARAELAAARAADTNNAALRRQVGAAQGAAGAINTLYASLATVIGVRTFIDAANDAQTLDNKIRAVSTSAEQFSFIQNKLYDMAIQNRVAVIDLGTAYQRFRNAMDGVADSDVLKFIDTLSKGLVVFGATTGEAASTITQLSQAFNKGKLDGDEFRSVAENFPPLMRALTQSLKVTKEEVYELSRSGKLNIETLLNAMKQIAPSIDQQFGRTIPTIAQALEVLQTKFTRFLSENSASAKVLGQAIGFIGDNLNVVVPLVVAFGVAWATVQIASVVAALWGMFTVIGSVAVALLPLVATVVTVIGLMYAFAAAIALVTGNWDNFHGWINTTIDDVGKLAAGLAGTAAKAVGINQLTQEQMAFGNAVAESAKSAADLRSQVTGLAGGVSTRQLTEDAKGTASALKETTTAAKGLREEVKLGAGEIATLSGQRSGVYDVKKALEETSGAMTQLSLDGKHTVETVKSLTGQVTGIYKITDAIKSNSNALQAAANSAARYAQQLTYAVRAAAKLSASFVPGIGSRISSPSFQDIGISNTGSNSSFAGSYATGGSFMVGGRPGRDKNPVTFNATKGERVSIQTRSQQRRANMGGGFVDARSYSLNIVTQDADSFRRSKQQVARDFGEIINQ